MKAIIDRCYRAALKIIYPIGTRAVRLIGYKLSGVFLFVWHDNRLLIVKNSYKTTYSLPGGLLKKGEDPILGAIREAHEEVGIHLQAKDLTLFSELKDDLGGSAYMVNVYLPQALPIHIDDREIVWADYIPRQQLADYPFHPAVITGLEHPDNPSVEPPTE